MKKVYLDPGHGGTDSGATGNEIKEKDIVLAVAKKLEVKLKKCNLDIRMSRTTDDYKTLEYRSTDANNWGADCFVSIHANSADATSAQGVETYCYKFAYRPLADKVHEEIIASKTYTKDRGVKEGNFHVVRETNMDACLVELAFISNAEDANLLKNKQDEFATAIAKGICKYLGVTYVDDNQTPPGEGFVNGDYSGRKARVTADVLNVRWDRGTEYDIIGQVKNGDIVNLQYCLNGWISIEGFNGNKGLGYVSTTYLELL
ncbi:N-acetylmuramoyl-L-alanine amidase [Paraclostridium bifermentans]|uniref:N-acetylmuramoyl-L-alanine amidase n=1 Tax=Paraclostridium bifermentans TaxID=1490 RepID=UPI0011DD28A5|nr:N-acetylmuramoyl-L-alanine amidase [Paraclostridium bifermentans]